MKESGQLFLEYISKIKPVIMDIRLASLTLLTMISHNDIIQNCDIWGFLRVPQAYVFNYNDFLTPVHIPYKFLSETN